MAAIPTPIEIGPVPARSSATVAVASVVAKLTLVVNPVDPVFVTANEKVELPVIEARETEVYGEFETLADWQAHVVTLDFFFLGYLRNKPGSATERHFFDVPAFFIDGAPRRLNIAVIGRGPGLEDDFVLKSIEASGFDLKLGWA